MWQDLIFSPVRFPDESEQSHELNLDPTPSGAVATDMTKYTTPIVILLFILLAAIPAFAGGFVSVPNSKNLQIKIVEYDGGTNGEMVVQVKNIASKSTSFSAHGIFFVPQIAAETAPQRLGASGPFEEVLKKKNKMHRTAVSLAAGETKTLRLEVFCLDSHRSSPTSKTKFTVAKKLLPKKLTEELRKTNAAVYKHNKGDVKKAKSAIQKNMWKNRDKKWIAVEGEGVQEATK